MYLSRVVLSAYIFVFTPVAYSSVQDGLVSAPWGKIRGIPKTSSSGLHMTSFEGIPYAQPPLGNLRFAKPVPSTGSNSSIYEADAIQPSCLMANNSRESEDCLYLDLYVPHSKTTSVTPSPMAVMIYIHGGGFVYYSGDMDASRLLSENIIVALVHYRLGAMGFLSTGDGVLKGNYGLWDQRLAFQWVRDNVAAFGGNPDSITIFGESAGSASVAYQILAPMGSKGLFQRAILQSGTATSSWALSRKPAEFARTLGARLGCSILYSNTDLAACLRKADAVHLQKEMFSQWQSTPPFQHVGDFMFVPVVDHEFVMAEPLHLIQNSSYLQKIGAVDIDVIIGVLNDEGTLVTLIPEPNIPNAPNFDDYFTHDIVPYMIQQRYGVSNKEVEGTVSSFYRNNMPSNLLTKFSVSNAFADTQFVIPALEFINALSKARTNVGTKLYFYYFNYCPSFSPLICMGHGYDLAFVFTYNVSFTSADKSVSEKFVSLLTTFAKTGIPTATDTPSWHQFSPTSKSYLEISSQPQNKVNLFPKRWLLWTETVPLLFSNPVIPAPIIG